MELTIPLLACKSLGATLDFYQALGFDVTYQQEQPYVYAAIQRGSTQLHFTKRVKPAMCLLFVPDVAPYHRTFAGALRAQYGRIPTAGTPRITRFRPEQTRFHLFDPSGNTLLYINQNEPDSDYARPNRNPSPLMQALENAAFLRDTYTDDKAAARVLDRALARHESTDGIERARVLAARAELAVAMDDDERAQAIRAEIQQVPLSDADRTRYQDELRAADQLEQWRSHTTDG